MPSESDRGGAPPGRYEFSELARMVYYHEERIKGLDESLHDVTRRLDDLFRDFQGQQIHLPGWALGVVGISVAALYALLSLFSTGRIAP